LSLTEPPINTLKELSEAMRDSGLQLLVEVQSASQAMLEVSVYNILYTLWMQTRRLIIIMYTYVTHLRTINTHTHTHTT